MISANTSWPHQVCTFMQKAGGTPLLPTKIPVTCKEVKKEFITAVNSPVARPPLHSFLREKKRLVLVLPDLTRPIPLVQAIHQIKTYLDHYQLTPNCTVLIALGSHRPRSATELAPCHNAAKPWQVKQHIFDDSRQNSLVEASFEAHINNYLLERPEDTAIVSLGALEAHQYAGFSGGYKMLTIGCGGISTLSHLHSLALLRNPNVTIGNLHSNPFQEALAEVGYAFGDRVFSINVVSLPETSQKKWMCLGVSAGAPEEALLEGAKMAESAFFFPISSHLDALIAGVFGPKSSNFYQATRAITYAALHKQCAIKEGGILILDAACSEGTGTGKGEIAFLETLARGPEVLLRELNTENIEEPSVGAQRAYVLARTLQKHRIWLVNNGTVRLPSTIPIRCFNTISMAISQLVKECPNATGLVSSNPFTQIPFWAP